eukprot:10593578-Prorocentrum_lima.AAC.1
MYTKQPCKTNPQAFEGQRPSVAAADTRYTTNDRVSCAAKAVNGVNMLDGADPATARIGYVATA